MGRFFDIDGPFIGGLTKMADLFILNLLLIICSIPVFTIGASVTAMYYVTLKMVKDEDCYPVKSFFRSFKQNFKQSTIIWIILLAVGALVRFDLKLVTGEYSEFLLLPGSVMKVLMILLMMSAVFYAFVISYVFPVLARFDNSIKNTLKNSFLMAIRHFPSTILIVIINIIPIVVMYFIPRAMILIFIGLSLCAYINSYLFVKIFKNYMPKEQITSDEEFEIK